MMSSKLFKVIVSSVLVLLLSACSLPPIQNVDDAPITASNANFDLSDVTKAIQRAGVGLGWQMKEQTPGHIVGTLHVRSHMAAVDITYTLDEYSINYKDSNNLKYNFSNGTIHRNYNSWVQNLTNAINVQLSSI